MVDKEIGNYQKQIRTVLGAKENLISEIDSLDYTDKHYERMKKDLNERLYKIYDNIDEFETRLKEAQMKKNSIQAEKITGENVYKILVCFEKLYDKMNEKQKRELIELLINEIHIFEEEKENGQWLKSINFRLPLLYDDINLRWDNGTHVETVVLLSHLKSDKHIDLDIELDEFDLTSAESKATYDEITKYVSEKFGLKVSNLAIAQTKRKYGIIERSNYNMPKSENSRQPMK